MQELCDFTYVVLVEDLEAEVRTQQLISATYLAQGHKVDMPDISEARTKLDDYLTAPLDAEPDEYHERLVLLGLRK